ncbi:MAG: hypothetical protein AB1512_02885 [Thermodesulfobacteriota bacterium]
MTLPEKRTSRALNMLGLRHTYEPTLFLPAESGIESIRYPDFYLPDLDLYIEVRSLDRSYDTKDRRVRKKNALYRQNEVNYVEIDPAYRDTDGNRRLKSLQAIEGDLRRKIGEYLEQRHLDSPSPFVRDSFGESDTCSVYEGWRRPRSYGSRQERGYGLGQPRAKHYGRKSFRGYG